MIFENLVDAQLAGFPYIENFYNTGQRHETLDHLSRNQFKANHQQTENQPKNRCLEAFLAANRK